MTSFSNKTMVWICNRMPQLQAVLRSIISNTFAPRHKDAYCCVMFKNI